MEKVTIYEYFIDNGELIKLTHNVKKTSNKYSLKAGKSKHHKTLREDDFNVIKSNRFFSFTDDMEMARSLLIANIEERIRTKEKTLKRDKQTLQNLKQSC